MSLATPIVFANNRPVCLLTLRAGIRARAVAVAAATIGLPWNSTRRDTEVFAALAVVRKIVVHPLQSSLPAVDT